MIFLAEHCAHHDHIWLCQHGLLPCAAPSAQQVASCLQQGCTQHDMHTPHQHVAPVQPVLANHTSAGHCMRDDTTPVVSTSVNSYMMLKLNSQPSLNCCVIGCDITVDSLWHYHHDSHQDC